MSRRKAVELVEEISRNILLFHRDRHRERNGARVSVETEVGVGPAQRAWMSGTGLEQVKRDTRWQRCSDHTREILATKHRGRNRVGGVRGATWGGGSSAERVQALGGRGQDLPRVQNVMDP